ncbi:MAG: hypothetical protein JNJ73_21035 [Hyphomonadaceae bacterium]|nr:hypothetical protein [Hyphomonadaceae bacterium]
MNRRLFLASATALLPAGALAATAPSAIVLYDRRHVAARRFAAERIRQGVGACDVQPDALAVWRALAPTLRQRPMRLEGMTTHSDFIVLQDCARAAGLKLVQSQMHDGRGAAEPTLFSWRFA